MHAPEKQVGLGINPSTSVPKPKLRHIAQNLQWLCDALWKYIFPFPNPVKPHIPYIQNAGASPVKFKFPPTLKGLPQPLRPTTRNPESQNPKPINPKQ